MEKQRVAYFDMAKGIGAILVLLGHMQGETFFNLSPYIHPFCEWIFSFHMPMFFLISGMLICYKGDVNRNLKELVKKRFFGIMLPYFSFSILNLVIRIYYVVADHSLSAGEYLQDFIDSVTFYGYSVLWFLPCLFLAELIFLGITKKLSRVQSCLVLFVCFAVALICNRALARGVYDTAHLERLHRVLLTFLRPVIAASFVTIGYYFYPVIEKMGRGICLAASVVLIAIDCLFVKVNGGVDFRTLTLKNEAAYYLCALCGSFGIVLLCKAIWINLKPLSFFGINSLIFMAVHNNKLVMIVALKTAMFINQFVTRARGYVFYFIVASIFVLYVTVMIFIINRYFPFMLGKKKAKS